MTLRAAVVGATGIAGQQFVETLASHPWFRITRLAASERSAGRTYREALRDPATGASRWWCTSDPPESVLGLTVEDAAHLDLTDVDVVFSAVESDAARQLEPLYAAHRPVISTASAFRYESDVPILIPGVNLDHAEALRWQQRQRGWKGFVLPIPNCTVTGLAITLKPLAERFGLEAVIMTSMQGLSGAGRSPGVIALDVVDNVIPFIPGEEGKVEVEAQKILGSWRPGEGFSPLSLPVSATCTRVAVLEGHTEAVYVRTRRPVDVAEAAAAFREFGREFTSLRLPSSPEHLILVHEDPYRPQPRLDRDAEGGMATTVGRIRPETALGPGIKYVLVTHNTKMGAAKGAVLLAEYLVHTGYIAERA